VKREKLLQKAISTPGNIRFGEFETLLKQSGFECIRSRGSHFHYYCEKFKKLLPVQEGKNGMAKEYQVLQFLSIMEENNAV
jgi:hypothetical protein